MQPREGLTSCSLLSIVYPTQRMYLGNQRRGARVAKQASLSKGKWSKGKYTLGILRSGYDGSKEAKYLGQGCPTLLFARVDRCVLIAM